MAKTDEERSPIPPQFERFDKVTAASARGAAAIASITMSSSGNFRFSPKLVENLTLRSGAGLAFFYDKEQEQWYMQRDDVNGFVLRADTKGGLQFNSSTLRYKITDTLSGKEESGRILLADEPVKFGPVKMWVLITASIGQGPKRRKRGEN